MLEPPIQKNIPWKGANTNIFWDDTLGKMKARGTHASCVNKDSTDTRHACLLLRTYHSIKVCISSWRCRKYLIYYRFLLSRELSSQFQRQQRIAAPHSSWLSIPWRACTDELGDKLPSLFNKSKPSKRCMQKRRRRDQKDRPTRT